MVNIGSTILIITLNVNDVINKNELLIYAITWMNLKNILSEGSQIKKTTLLEISTNITAVEIKLTAYF